MTALVIIARAPERGRVKTRLAATLGPDRTLGIYRQLLARTAQVAAAWPGPVLLCAAGPDAWAGTGLEHLPRRPQPDGGLGARIRAALEAGLDRAPRAIAIGSDCPALDGAALAAVGAALAGHAAAFGPAVDGGFWAVGVADPVAAAAMGDDALPWSTDHTRAACRDRLTTCGLTSTDAGPALDDCDDEPAWRAAVAAGLLPPD
ncbi:MAG: hypothetical protein RLZZ127_2999 [Planctomycetota bacterium]|jgi:glycosyltransferase A (GT-A) superfamily protein (DUF2064 family)